MDRSILQLEFLSDHDLLFPIMIHAILEILHCLTSSIRYGLDDGIDQWTRKYTVAITLTGMWKGLNRSMFLQNRFPIFQ